MKQITLNIPEKKIRFFLELVNHLGFEVASENDIPEEHKSIVRARMKDSTPDSMLNWEIAKEKLEFSNRKS